MNNQKSYTGRILLTILLFSAAFVLFIVGIVQSFMLLRLKIVCTAETTGIVEEIKTGFVKSTDRIETRFLKEGENREFMRISVDPGSGFGRDFIYVNPGKEDSVGTTVTIHFSSDDPYDHYVNSWLGVYKTTGIMTLAAGAAALLTLLLLLRLSKLNKAAEQRRIKRHICFDTPYCRFLFIPTDDVGYEGETEWEFNKQGEKTCTAYFDADSLPSGTPESFTDLTEVILAGVSDDKEITQIASEDPRLMTVLPGECYKRLQKYLYDKERTDLMIRRAVAHYFLLKPDLIRENSTEQELMDGLELSFIGSYRNGNTEFGIYYSHDIYVDDLHVVIKPDGGREIRYKTDDSRYTGTEICDEI